MVYQYNTARRSDTKPIRQRAAGPGTIAFPITSVAGHAAISFPCAFLLRFRDGGNLSVSCWCLLLPVACCSVNGARQFRVVPVTDCVSKSAGRAAPGSDVGRVYRFFKFRIPASQFCRGPCCNIIDLRLVYRVVNLAETQTPDDNRLSVDIPILVPEGTKNGRWCDICRMDVG